MSTTTLAKPASKSTPLKEQMSYVDALTIIEKQNKKIKESAQNRIDHIRRPEYAIYGRNLAKSFSSVFVSMATFLTLGTSGMIDHNAAGFFAFGAFAVGSISSIIVSGSGKYSRIVSPVKYRQLLSEYDAHENLRKLKELEYEKVEKKAIKKAEDAMKVANRTLASNSKGIRYSRRLGSEGFSVAEIGDPSEIAQERLRAISELDQLTVAAKAEQKALSANFEKQKAE